MDLGGEEMVTCVSGIEMQDAWARVKANISAVQYSISLEGISRRHAGSSSSEWHSYGQGEWRLILWGREGEVK